MLQMNHYLTFKSSNDDLKVGRVCYLTKDQQNLVSFTCFATMDGAIDTGTVLSETVSLPFTFIRRPKDIRPWAITRMATQNLRNDMPRWPVRWPAWYRMRTSTRRARSPAGLVKERS